MFKQTFYKKDIIYIFEKGIPVIATVVDPKKYVQIEYIDRISLFALESEYSLLQINLKKI